MKKLSILALIAISVFLCFAPQLGAGGSAYASDGANYKVILPELDNYLFLDEPRLTAISGGKTAVYDIGFKKVFISGTEQAEYPVVLDADEKLIRLVFANGKLYGFTDRSKLTCFTDDAEIDLGDRESSEIYSHGDKLYLYNGLSSVYSYDGENFEKFGDTSRKIIGSESFACDGTQTYFLKENIIYKLPLTTNAESQKIIETEDADKLCVIGEKLCVIKNNQKANQLDFYEKSGGEAVGSFSLAEAFPEIAGVSVIETDGANVAVINAAEKAVYKYGYDGKFTLADMYGCSSNKSGWYNNPAAVTATPDGGLLVWDKGNGRVQRLDFGGNNVELYYNYPKSFSFDAFVSDGNTAVFLARGEIFYTALPENGGDISPVKMECGLRADAVCVLNNVIYVYDSGSREIYCAEIAQKPSFKLFCISPRNIKKMIVRGGDNAIVYALTSDGADSKIELFTYIGKANAEIQPSFALSDFDVDYTGSVIAFINEDSGISCVKYQRSFGGFSEAAVVMLSGPYPLKGINFGTLSENGKAYGLDCKKNLLVEITAHSFNTASDFVPSGVVDTAAAKADDISFAKARGTSVYRYKNNFLDLSDNVTAGGILTVINEFSDSETLFVITEKGKSGYILRSAATAVTPQAIENLTVCALHDVVNVYNLPSANESSYKTFDKSKVFTVIDNCADFNNGNSWYKVSYDENGETRLGYLIKTRVMKYHEIPVIEEPVFAKAKSQRIGAKVNIYAMTDLESAVVASVTDGTKLKLLEDYDPDSEFTFVEFEGNVGYVLTAELQINKGLTKGQIAAIVLGSVTLLITALFLIIGKRNRKLGNK